MYKLSPVLLSMTIRGQEYSLKTSPGENHETSVLEKGFL